MALKEMRDHLRLLLTTLSVLQGDESLTHSHSAERPGTLPAVMRAAALDISDITGPQSLCWWVVATHTGYTCNIRITCVLLSQD